MVLFEQILKDMHLLNEDASVSDVNDAISRMHPAIITYINQEGNKQAKGKRKIYPVAYGISSAGNPVVRAFEKEGDTTTRVPAWKLFIVPNIMSWKTIQDETFEDEELVGLNKDGRDEQIVTLYNVSPLSDEANKWRNNEPIIKSTPVQKSDISNNKEYSAKDIVNNSIYSSKSEKDIDNIEQKDYISNKDSGNRVMAPKETEPVTKSEIQTNVEPNVAIQPNDGNTDNERMIANDEPVSKEEIENQEPEITTAYNDMMNRWEDKEEE